MHKKTEVHFKRIHKLALMIKGLENIRSVIGT